MWLKGSWSLIVELWLLTAAGGCWRCGGHGFESMCRFCSDGFVFQICACNLFCCAQELEATKDKSWDYSEDGLAAMKVEIEAAEVAKKPPAIAISPDRSSRLPALPAECLLDSPVRGQSSKRPADGLVDEPVRLKRQKVEPTEMPDEGPGVGQQWWCRRASYKIAKNGEFFFDSETKAIYAKYIVGKAEDKKFVQKRLTEDDVYIVTVKDVQSSEGVATVICDPDAFEEEGVAWKRLLSLMPETQANQ